MENQDSMEIYPSLTFEPPSSQNTLNQRKILEFCAQEVSKRCKSEVLASKYIEGLASVLQLDGQKLMMIPEHILIPEFSSLIQAASARELKPCQQLCLDSENAAILLVGKVKLMSEATGPSIPPKQTDNMGKGSRQRANSSAPRANNSGSRANSSNETRKYRRINGQPHEIQILESMPPVLLEDDVRKIRNCSEGTVSTLITFPKNSIAKTSAFIEHEERRIVTRFVSRCLQIDEPRAASKVYAKISRNRLHRKDQCTLEVNKIYMVYSGQILLINEEFRVYLKRNGIIRPEADHSWHITMVEDSVVVAVDCQSALELSHQFYPEVLSKIESHLRFVTQQRRLLFHKQVAAESLREQQDQKQLAKAFFSHYLPHKTLESNEVILNELRIKPVPLQVSLLKAAEKVSALKYKPETMSHRQDQETVNCQVEISSQQSTDRPKQTGKGPKRQYRRESGDKSRNTARSGFPRRFKVKSLKFQNSEELYNEPKYTSFMSIYPYCKIVEGHEILCQRKQLMQNQQKNEGNQPELAKKAELQKESNQAKQNKKFYYMDKVRRLKIKNIAERQIPKAKKKQFKTMEAEREIASYCLFNSAIEYPVKGSARHLQDKTSLNSSTITLTNSKVLRSTESVDFLNQTLKKSHNLELSCAQNCTPILNVPNKTECQGILCDSSNNQSAGSKMLSKASTSLQDSQKLSARRLSSCTCNKKPVTRKIIISSSVTQVQRAVP